MTQTTPTTHGGARPGAGRISKNGPTKSVAFRIPLADIEYLQQYGVENLSKFYIDAGKKEIKKLKKKI